ELVASVINSKAKRVLVLNLPEPESANEFAGSSAPDHLDFILHHVPELRIDYAIVDPSAIEIDSRLKGLVEGLGGELVVSPLAKAPGSYHHDVEKLRSVFAHIMEPTLLR